MVVERRGLDVDRRGEPAHRQRIEALRVGDGERCGEELIAGERFGSLLWVGHRTPIAGRQLTLTVLGDIKMAPS